MSRLSLDMTTVRIPTATYRLQFNKNFTFRQAREVVTYLHHLGISEAYASPSFQAAAESLHGYDITDHNKINAAMGSREDYDAWIAELQVHSMGQIADFVPTHVGINDPQNVWWQDVLENGPSSLYAPYFDIDWRPLKTDLHDKVLLPILGDQYGRVLERGELRIHFDGGSFSLTYFDHVFPIAPGTYRYILELALENLAEFREEDFYAEFQSIRTALEYLPRRTETDPDGLYRPLEYFEKLQSRCAKALRVPLAKDGRAIYLIVEKILTGDEQLPKNWPVHGTTGYDFANQVAGVLVDHNAEGAISKIFKRFVGHSLHFGHLVYAKKRLVMRISLANEVNVLGNMVDRLSEQNRWFRDYTLEALARAVRETIACFPVYRTYLEPGKPVSEEDRAVIERAVAAAKRRNPAIEESVFNFLRDLLLFRFPENLDEAQRAAHAEFVLKFQQFTGPIMAKGLEDTVFYIYNRLAALNEVGGEPQIFGLTVGAFHPPHLT